VPGIAVAGLANGHPATAAIVLTEPHHDHLVLPGSGHAH
jgi:phosphoribosyl 1,2-cyclic phosphodiesterase